MILAITFGIIAVLLCLKNSFAIEVRRLVIAILLKTKAWYLQNQINEKDKHPIAILEQ